MVHNKSKVVSTPSANHFFFNRPTTPQLPNSPLPTLHSKLLYILYCKLQTPHCKLQTAHCKLPTPHSPLLHLSSLSTANCPLITSSWRVPPAVGSGFRLMYRPLRVRHAASIPRAHCNASTAARRANQRSCHRTHSSRKVRQLYVGVHKPSILQSYYIVYKKSGKKLNNC